MDSWLHCFGPEARPSDHDSQETETAEKEHILASFLLHCCSIRAPSYSIMTLTFRADLAQLVAVPCVSAFTNTLRSMYYQSLVSENNEIGNHDFQSSSWLNFTLLGSYFYHMLLYYVAKGGKWYFSELQLFYIKMYMFS
jgi:hypothetical protein